jgi:type 1 fimbriae regulatory protein FimB
VLRNAAGYYLANNGQELRVIQDYLGHRNVQHTVLNAQPAAGRFKSLL